MNSNFQTWFEQREPNDELRCDNIYDAIQLLTDADKIYDFVESMMLVSWCAAVRHTQESLE